MSRRWFGGLIGLVWFLPRDLGEVGHVGVVGEVVFGGVALVLLELAEVSQGPVEGEFEALLVAGEAVEGLVGLLGGEEGGQEALGGDGGGWGLVLLLLVLFVLLVIVLVLVLVVVPESGDAVEGVDPLPFLPGLCLEILFPGGVEELLGLRRRLSRHWAQTTLSASSSWAGLRGWREARRPWRKARYSAPSSWGRRTLVSQKRPWVVALRELLALPSGVLGPVDFWALARLAASFFSEIP